MKEGPKGKMMSVFKLGLTKRGRRRGPTGDQGDKVYALPWGFTEDSLTP
jgi:hypothetical protein